MIDVETNIKRVLAALGSGIPPLTIVDKLIESGLSAEDAFLLIHAADILLKDKEGIEGIESEV